MPACPATGKTDMSDRMFLTLGEIIRVPHRLPASKATDKAVHYGDGRGNECCPNRSRRDRVHLDSVGREHLGQPAGPTSVSGGMSATPSIRTSFSRPLLAFEKFRCRLKLDPSLDELQCGSVATETQLVAHYGSPRGYTQGYTGNSDRAERPYFTGLSRNCFKVAEREGFAPPFQPNAQHLVALIVC